MPNLFINPGDEFEVKIAVGQAKDNTHQILADVSVEKLKEVYGETLDPTSVEEITAWFRYPDFSDQAKIYDTGVKVENNTFQINPQSLRLKRITQLIKRWTYKGNDGKPIVANEDAVKRLHPVVATVLGLQLEEEMQKLGIQ